MKSTTQINNNFHADPLSHREGSPNQPTSFFDNLQALDGVQFRTSIDDFYGSLPTYYVADTTTPAVYYDAATDPVLSMGIPAGDLKVTEATLYNMYDFYNGSDTYYSPPYYMSPLSTPHIRQDCASLYPQYYNYNYEGYTSPVYSTAQVLNVKSRSSTCKDLLSYHIDAGVSMNDIPFGSVMQSQQEPESLRASDCSNQHIPVQPIYAGVQYTSNFTDANLQQCDKFRDNHASGTAPAFYQYDSSISPSGSMTSLDSWSAQRTMPPSSLPSIPSPVSSSDFATPQLDLSPLSPPALNEPSPPSYDYQPVPTLDHGPRPAVPPVLALPASTSMPEPEAQSGGRKPRICSQSLLDKYFGKVKKGRCKLCGKGPEKYRDDRGLEHLASKHAWQMVKDMNEFKKPKRGCLVKTCAQFAFAQETIEEVRCRFCLKKTNLVLRQDIVDYHIDVHHSTLGEEVRKAEKSRVSKLMRGEEGFYNYHDQFLYNLYRV